MSTAPTRKRRPKKADAAPVVEAVEQAEIAAPALAKADRVSLADLHAMRLAQMEKRALKAEMESARMSKLYVLSMLDKKGLVAGLEKKIEAAQKDIEAAENKELIAKKRMEHAIGRPLTGLAIDPDSGEVADFSKR